MSLINSIDLAYTSRAIEERGYLDPEALEYISSDLNIKEVRVFQSHEITTTQLPIKLRSLDFIHIVDLSGTQITADELEYLPPRIKVLNLEDCEQVDYLPRWLSSLEFLTELNVSKTDIENYALETLPPTLEILKINYCSRITKLPENLGTLRNLETLFMRGTKVTELHHLPLSIVNVYAEQSPIANLRAGHYWSRLENIQISYKYFNVDTINTIALRMSTCAVRLKTVSFDSESALAFYVQLTQQTFQKNTYTDENCIELFKKTFPRFKDVSFFITAPVKTLK